MCPLNQHVLLVDGNSSRHYAFLVNFLKTARSMLPCEAVMETNINKIFDKLQTIFLTILGFHFKNNKREIIIY